MRAIVLDPVGDRLYFASYGGGGVEVINVDGSSRTKLVADSAFSLAVDLKAG